MPSFYSFLWLEYSHLEYQNEIMQMDFEDLVSSNNTKQVLVIHKFI